MSSQTVTIRFYLRTCNALKFASDEYPINEHFSPPLVHPSLGSTHNLPPGSTINNRDSFNLSNNDVGSSYKDNPRPYGGALVSGICTEVSLIYHSCTVFRPFRGQKS